MMIIFRRLLGVFLVTWLSMFELTTFAQASKALAIPKSAAGPVAQASDAGLLDAPVFFHVEKDELILQSPPLQSTQVTLLQKGKAANLTLEPLKPFALGDHPTLVLHLTTEFGKPIRNQPIIIFVDRIRKASGQTDSAGIASIILRYKFRAGTYHIKAVYPGVPVLRLPAASVEADMIIQPARATIRTVPPTAGINFRFNHQIYTSDEKGFVNIQIEQSGSYPLEVLPVDNEILPFDIAMKFSRWNDNVFAPNRQVYFPRVHPLEAGFVIRYLVNEIFFDSTGAVVDPARVSAMTIKGLGRTYTYDQAGPIWLPANRLTRRISEQLESQNIVYYFKDVQIDGANVINKSQQRFHIKPSDIWSINVLVYSIHFSAHDAMFHSPIGSGIELTYPDGHMQKFLFDASDAEIIIPSLARGSYSATVIGGGGSAPPTPIHLSRDQDVELLVLSFLDMAIISGVPLTFALVLFFMGRPRLFRALRHPSGIRKLVFQNSHEDTPAS